MNKTNYTRREFAALSMFGLGAVLVKNKARLKYQYLAFDIFAIFDPSPVAALIKNKYPEKGAALFNEWRDKQFQYTWLLTSAEKFEGFDVVLKHSLLHAAKAQGMMLNNLEVDEFVKAYYNLNLWPDTLIGLQKLKANNARMVILSNFTSEMLQQNVKKNNISHLFDALISADEVKKFKPSPAIYALGPTNFKVPTSSILFVPFAPWDAAGAKLYGYPVYWVNRAKSLPEEIAILPDGTGSTLNDLCNWLQ